MSAILLASCARRDQGYTPLEFSKGETAVVVMRTNIGYANETPTKPKTFTSYWEEKKSFGYFRLLPFSEFTLGLISPGQYTLNRINLREPSIDPMQNNDSRNVSEGSISFEIKAGEILYIGDFTTNYCCNSIHLRDDFPPAKAFIDKHFPELSKKLTKKIAQKSHDFKLELNTVAAVVCKSMKNSGHQGDCFNKDVK